jgi:hypothetical protein
MENLLDRVWEYSKNNPEGFTLNLENFKPLKFGYSVGYLETQNCFGREGLQKALDHALSHDKIIGGWLNSENQFYYYDSIRVFKSLDDAIKFGEENKQIAIFSLHEGREIELGG